MTKRIIIPVFAAFLAVAAGCDKTEKGEEDAAKVEAAMMEGREAARIFVNRPWKDTVELQRNLLEARARRTKYDTIGQPKAAAAYDSAFVSTICTVNPEVAAHIK